ncbi:M20/M25/M40 family metallo-hydrolase [soil metagenome]
MTTHVSRARFLAALAAFTTLCLAAPAAQHPLLPDRVRSAAEGITAAQLKADLEFLASDELLGRNTPSPGFDTAAAYIVARLARAGLKPAGDDGTFLQHYEMRESLVETDGAYVQVGEERVPFGDGFVVRSFARDLTGELPVVYVGHGWVVPDEDIDPYRGLDVKGKLVLAHGPRALPKGVEIRQLGRVSVGGTSPMVEAQKRGAAGLVFIPQTGVLKGWDEMRGQNRSRRELEPGVPSAYAAQPLTSLLLAPQVVEALFEGEKIGGKNMIARGDAQEYPASFQLTRPLRVHLTADTTVHRPYNVVAMIEGSDPELRNESITIMSHLDGAVGTRTVDGDAIYNSADDNASGSAGNLAIAEQMAALKPKRSLVFVWDSGEEQGLWGTRWFVHQPPVPLEQVVAHFNIDMIGANRAPGSRDEHSPGVTGPNEVFLIGPGVLSARADALLEQVNREYLGMRFNREFDTPRSEFFYPRTDAGPFLERGLLTIGFTTGVHDRYHLPADEAQYLDPSKMEAITRTIFAAIWAFADVAERPGIDQPIPETVPRYR